MVADLIDRQLWEAVHGLRRRRTVRVLRSRPVLRCLSPSLIVFSHGPTTTTLASHPRRRPMVNLRRAMRTQPVRTPNTRPGPSNCTVARRRTSATVATTAICPSTAGTGTVGTDLYHVTRRLHSISRAVGLLLRYPTSFILIPRTWRHREHCPSSSSSHSTATGRTTVQLWWSRLHVLEWTECTVRLMTGRNSISRPCPPTSSMKGWVNRVISHSLAVPS